jgi:hypothetical protein
VPRRVPGCCIAWVPGLGAPRRKARPPQPPMRGARRQGGAHGSATLWRSAAQSPPHMLLSCDLLLCGAPRCRVGPAGHPIPLPPPLGGAPRDGAPAPAPTPSPPGWDLPAEMAPRRMVLRWLHGSAQGAAGRRAAWHGQAGRAHAAEGAGLRARGQRELPRGERRGGLGARGGRAAAAGCGFGRRAVRGGMGARMRQRVERFGRGRGEGAAAVGGAQWTCMGVVLLGLFHQAELAGSGHRRAALPHTPCCRGIADSVVVPTVEAGGRGGARRSGGLTPALTCVQGTGCASPGAQSAALRGGGNQWGSRLPAGGSSTTVARHGADPQQPPNTPLPSCCKPDPK